MNILLIVPLNDPYDTVICASKAALKTKLNSRKKIKKLDCVYPTGLLSISAYIKKHIPDVNIKILDFNAVMNMDVERKVDSFDEYKFENFLDEAFSLLGGFIPDIIGTSTLFCNNYQDLKPLTSFLRKRYPEGLIVCGGHVASSLYERIYEDNLGFDALAFGEGEIPSLELVRAVLSGEEEEYLSLSPCWITKSKINSEAEFVPTSKAITDLDEIPPFDLAMLVFPGVYFDSSGFLFMPETHEYKKEMFIFSTRGCPYNCVFCASHRVHGRKVRLYSLERIKKDILYYNERYGVTRFVFYDDHFLINKKRALEILDFISRKNFTATIINPAFFSIDKDIALAMRQAGVKSVILSIESGNEETFKNIIHKPSSFKKASEAVDILHDKGINAATNVIIGLPGETKESIEDGLEYLLTTKFDWFQCFVAAPLPGSDLFEICKEGGYLIADYSIASIDYKKCFIKTEDFAPEYIEKKVYEMNLKLNFADNYNFRAGNYGTALMLFERIINSVIDTHAFAYYFAARCCRMLKLDKKYKIYKARFEELIAKYQFWKEYAVQFNLEKLD